MDRLIKLVLAVAICLAVANLSGCSGGGGGGTSSNQAPVANAGSNQTVTLLPGQSTTIVTLHGSASDTDGSVAGYSWSGTPKPADVASPGVTLGVGVFTFTLIATDNQGAQSSASSVTVTVNAAPTRAIIVFNTHLPANSLEQIGSVDLSFELPAGVSLSTGAGAVSTGAGGVLNFSGEGARFAAQSGNSTTILGNYTPAALSSSAVINMSFVTLTSAGLGMNPGEIATLVCDLTPGVTVDMTAFRLISVLIGNANGVKLFDTLGGITGPASATFNVTLQ